MVCPFCSGETAVINSRSQNRHNGIWRRRKCLKCKSVFTSLEQIDLKTVLRVKTRDGLEAFNADILYVDILDSLKERKNRYIEARELTATVLSKILPKPARLSSTDISTAAADVLKRFDKRAWHSYIAKHPSLL